MVTFLLLESPEALIFALAFTTIVLLMITSRCHEPPRQQLILPAVAMVPAAAAI